MKVHVKPVETETKSNFMSIDDIKELIVCAKKQGVVLHINLYEDHCYIEMDPNEREDEADDNCEDSGVIFVPADLFE